MKLIKNHTIHPTQRDLLVVTFTAIFTVITWLYALSPGMAAQEPGANAATPTPTLQTNPGDGSENYFPVIIRIIPTATPPPGPPETVLYCSNHVLGIPNNDPSGVNDAIYIADPRAVLDVDVRPEIYHTWVGDLVVRLTHQASGLSITLLDRPGIPASQYGCGNDDVRAIFDDQITLPVEKRCAPYPAAISGIFQPVEALQAFNGLSAKGDWVINVADVSANDTGKLQNWCLRMVLGDPSQIPQPSPPPPASPDTGLVTGVTSVAQSLPLDCESRVAVDWARFFGVVIAELDFFNTLPASDNPDAGFVGNVYGTWGQIPPGDYGVHAEPVAKKLRKFGTTAYAHRPLSWDGLKAEIAAGRPVYVWTIGDSTSNEIPIYYIAGDGHLSVVAHYEHTVMVVGYSPNDVTILDNGKQYTRSLTQFLSSWSALGNMAITASP